MEKNKWHRYIFKMRQEEQEASKNCSSNLAIHSNTLSRRIQEN